MIKQQGRNLDMEYREKQGCYGLASMADKIENYVLVSYEAQKGVEIYE